MTSGAGGTACECTAAAVRPSAATAALAAMKSLRLVRNVSSAIVDVRLQNFCQLSYKDTELHGKSRNNTDRSVLLSRKSYASCQGFSSAGSWERTHPACKGVGHPGQAGSVRSQGRPR